jgi:hypothetical protein
MRRLAIVLLVSLALLLGVQASGDTGKLVQVKTTAYFPNVYSTPNALPIAVSLQQGTHNALVEVSFLPAVRGVSVCIQRALTTPASPEAWSSCTYSYTHTSKEDLYDFTFNITDIEGNVPYNVNLMLVPTEKVKTASAQVFFTIDMCTPGTYTRSIHDPSQCAPVMSLQSPGRANFNVSGNMPMTTHYFIMPAPNTRADELVTGMHLNVSLPMSLENGASWEFYASANMPASFVGYDFYASSTTPGYESGVFHITTPSPGIWYLALIIHHGLNGNPAFNASIEAIVETQSPASLGPLISDDNNIVIGPEQNDPTSLRLFRLESPDGAIYLSLSLLFPTKLPLGAPLPYKVFIAMNSVPGTFMGPIDVNATNVFADWTGCSMAQSDCQRTMIINLPAPPGRNKDPVTYMIGVLPVGNFQGTRFVLWKGSPCPNCVRGICQTKPENYGSCQCPKGWLQIDCSKWGEDGLTPQMIVIISVMAFFAVFGLVTLVYIIYTKRARLFPSKFGPTSDGYTSINHNDKSGNMDDE